MAATTPGLNRRTMLVASTVGFAGYQFSPLAASAATTASRGKGGKARSTILFFLCGGSSHLDMWDLKPEAPLEYRGPFQPIATRVPGLQLSEHLPFLSQQAQHLSILRSVSGRVSTNDHHAGYYYQLTGHEADPTFLSLGNNRRPMPSDWPYMGCVVGSRRPTGPGLPNVVSLPYMPSRAPYTRPGQFAARLGIEHDPMYVLADYKDPLKFSAPALVLERDLNAPRIQARHELLQSLNEARRALDDKADVQTWSRQQERALTLLGSTGTTAAFDVAQEPATLRERYGQTVNGMSLLIARRLVEAGVPFISIFWNESNDRIASKCKSGGGWDTHGNNFNCLKDDLLPEFDRGFSALIEDLDQRQLLDETLLLVTSEMGRKPKIGDPRSGGTSNGLYTSGRDHWTHCLSVVMAGGGLQGGAVYGSSDRLGEYPADRPITPAHVAHTVYHAMGIDQLEARDKDGRVFNLLDSGEPLTSLF